MTFSSKLPWVGTTIFTQMSQLAQSQQAINLAQGFPDFPAESQLLLALNQHVLAGQNQYAPMPGVLALRQQIATLTARCYGVLPDPEHEITVTSGATEAIFVAIQAVVRAGDEVIIFDPAYDSYQPAIALAGGVTVHIQLGAPDFRINWNEVAAKITNKTRLIIVNSPHNPTGVVFDSSDWQALATLVQQYNLFCISDEVYQHIIFEPAQRQSAVQYAGLRERCFIVSSFGKTFHVTGWKLGYCLAPASLTTELRKIHQYVTFSSFTAAQYAIADVLAQSPQLVDAVAVDYQQKRDTFANLLEPSKFQLLPCAGTYFQVVDYSELSALPDVEFCHWLTCEHKVAAIPLSVFSKQPSADKLIRLCFAKSNTTLEHAAEWLCQIN